MAEKDSSCLLRSLQGRVKNFFFYWIYAGEERTNFASGFPDLQLKKKERWVRSSIQKRLFRTFKSKFAARRIEIWPNGLRVVSVGYWYIITSFAIGSLSFPESKKSFGRDQKSKAE
jgi:hypothetical protein